MSQLNYESELDETYLMSDEHPILKPREFNKEKNPFFLTKRHNFENEITDLEALEERPLSIGRKLETLGSKELVTPFTELNKLPLNRKNKKLNYNSRSTGIQKIDEYDFGEFNEGNNEEIFESKTKLFKKLNMSQKKRNSILPQEIESFFSLELYSNSSNPQEFSSLNSQSTILKMLKEVQNQNIKTLFGYFSPKKEVQKDMLALPSPNIENESLINEDDLKRELGMIIRFKKRQKFQNNFNK